MKGARGICGLALALVLAGCGGAANHLGNPLSWPLSWPGSAIGAAVGNATYGPRRDRVAAHVATHQQAILAEARAGGGPALTRAMDLAAVPATRRAALTTELARGAAQYAADPEALVVALMVHGG